MNRKSALLLLGILPVLLFAIAAWPAPAQKGQPKPTGERPPRGQSTLPGPALSPAEAIKKMKVPDGFRVELVAAEPAIVNPVAMTFDERGRIWITESLEYPRSAAGPGQDRIKVLESTKGDGHYDKITVFADGLNIPSGIAVGHGGVWVANSPDIFFYREGPDGKAAGKPEVVVTGFGRSDTHELPNSLTWGPDGWLYGLNGVFNRSVVKYRGKTYDFTCALFRIQPRTRDFELFCEGTSNPWGVAFDTEGSAFVSACVIDHLWHLVQSGYYHRQGGPYPPHTWKIESIVKHRHQKAAYCGIHFFDSDAYPPEYREKLYMGNIHGNCINVDEVTRDGSTYFGKPRPDFLTANDAWFMPVAQRTGPDGCLYLLDWYDRYHCYQDAQRDPAGIDRVNGRLYRVVHKDYKAPGKFDLGKESDEQLIERLHSPNVFYRDLAQRLLTERNHPATRAKLEKLILDDQAPRKARMHALWALVGAGPLEPGFHQRLLAHADPAYRAWGVRAAANSGKVADTIRTRITALATDPSPDVRLQVAIAARKLGDAEAALRLLLAVQATSGEDRLIPHVVWQNLHPLLEQHNLTFLGLLGVRYPRDRAVAQLMPRYIDYMVDNPKGDPAPVVDFLERMLAGPANTEGVIHLCLLGLARKVESGELRGPALQSFKKRMDPLLARLQGKKDGSLYHDAVFLAASLGDRSGQLAARQCLSDANQPSETRLDALAALVASATPGLIDAVVPLLADRQAGSAAFRGQLLSSLGRLDDPRVADAVLSRYTGLEAELQPRAVELLTQRPGWSKQLMQAIAKKQIPANVLNVNQARRLLASKDAELVKLVQRHYGAVRDSRNPEREKIVAEMRTFLTKQRGEATAGWKVFKNVCAQCHKMYGEGVDVGPDITSNGRSDFEHLLSNVFDPSLVIGAGFQATTVTTTKGQVLTGLVVEDNAQRVVLKTQGGKLETVPRGEVEALSVSQVSLMPEGLEKQLRPQEIADLFAFLTLDRPPGDPRAKLIPGTPR